MLDEKNEPYLFICSQRKIILLSEDQNRMPNVISGKAVSYINQTFFVFIYVLNTVNESYIYLNPGTRKS